MSECAIPPLPTNKFKKMTITVEVTGYGNEIVVGGITPLEYKRIKDYMRENDIDDFDDFYNSDGPSELDLPSWYDNDGLVHAYGPNDESEMTITDEDGDVLFDDVTMNLEDETPLYREETEEYETEGDDILFFGSSMENGTWYAEIEIPDDEEFDITKLGITARNIQTDYEGGFVFDKLTYDGDVYDLELESSETENLYIFIPEE